MHRTSRCLTCRCAEKEVTVRALRLLFRCHSFFWSILVTHVVIHSAAQFNTVTKSPWHNCCSIPQKLWHKCWYFSPSIRVGTLRSLPTIMLLINCDDNSNPQCSMLTHNPQFEPTMLNHCNDKWWPDNSPIDSPVPKTMVSWTECKQQLHKRNAHNLLKLVAPFQNV